MASYDLLLAAGLVAVLGRDPADGVRERRGEDGPQRGADLLVVVQEEVEHAHELGGRAALGGALGPPEQVGRDLVERS